jgi:glyoxylase-like metal-dependent hydrolase (beta-lactamase superfamily II)
MDNRKKPSVKIVKVGTICYEPSEIASNYLLQLKAGMGIGGGSTVTLIQADRTILVDTGFDFEWNSSKENEKRNANILTRALKDQRLKPEDIDIVFVTHWHRDHFSNIGIFKNARLLAPKSLVERFKLEKFEGINDEAYIDEGVKVIKTPGHTIDHASLLVSTDLNGVKARIAVAGDAIISCSYFQAGHVWKYNSDFFNEGETKKSISKIIASSDVIIPGHGVPFMTHKPGWMI